MRCAGQSIRRIRGKAGSGVGVLRSTRQYGVSQNIANLRSEIKQGTRTHALDTAINFQTMSCRKGKFYT